MSRVDGTDPAGVQMLLYQGLPSIAIFMGSAVRARLDGPVRVFQADVAINICWKVIYVCELA